MTKLSVPVLNENNISWHYGDKLVKIAMDKISQVLYDEKRELVFALENEGNEDASEVIYLHVFSGAGTLIVSLKPPKDFLFAYLTKHPEVGVAIVAGAGNRIDGWYDWHFGYDDCKKDLFRHCPAY